jgi:hypothetical protein
LPAGTRPSGLPQSDGWPVPPGLQVARAGSFRSLEHATTGRAIVPRHPARHPILRLERLSTSNGPDLRAYLSRVPASSDLPAYRTGFIDLGALKGNRGSQNYAIPAGTDLSAFNSAVIWCRRFAVGFGVAPLKPWTPQRQQITPGAVQDSRASDNNAAPIRRLGARLSQSWLSGRRSAGLPA